MDESLDLYSAAGEPLGRSKARTLVHRDGDWHRSFHCWIVFRRDSGEEMILLQKRGSEVELWPNKLDISAAGHYRSGETIEDGGLREIREELGITITQKELLPAGIRVNVDERLPGICNHELQEVYFLLKDQALEYYAPQISEVAGLLEMPIQTLLQLLSGKIDKAVVPAFMLDHNTMNYRLCESAVSAEDFIPSVDDYLFRVAIAAQRVLSREKYFRI